MANEVPLEQVAKTVFGITPRRYRQMASEDIVPAPEKGKIDFVRAAKALIDYYRNLAAGQGSLNLTDVRIRKEAARAEREELLVKKLKGELVPKDQSIAWLTSMVSAARLGFQNLPKRLAPVVRLKKDEKDIEVEIRAEVHKILKELAKPLNADAGHNGGKKRSPR